MKRHLCPDCLSDYKRSREGRAAKKARIAWGKGYWPEWIYHEEETRKCRKHHVQALADSAARRAGLDMATPKWADRKAIKAVYDEALRLTKITGVRHEVDHIVPLKGERVSGLHVHWNLRAIPHHENRKKSNRFRPGDG